MNKIGLKIKEARERAGVKQGELAEFIDISQPALNKIEKGKTKNITLNTAIKIAKKLNLSFMSFYGIEDENRTRQEDNLNSIELFTNRRINKLQDEYTRKVQLLLKVDSTISRRKLLEEIYDLSIRISDLTE